MAQPRTAVRSPVLSGRSAASEMRRRTPATGVAIRSWPEGEQETEKENDGSHAEWLKRMSQAESRDERCMHQHRFAPGFSARVD